MPFFLYLSLFVWSCLTVATCEVLFHSTFNNSFFSISPTGTRTVYPTSEEDIFIESIALLNETLFFSTFQAIESVPTSNLQTPTSVIDSLIKVTLSGHNFYTSKGTVSVSVQNYPCESVQVHSSSLLTCYLLHFPSSSSSSAIGNSDVHISIPGFGDSTGVHPFPDSILNMGSYTKPILTAVEVSSIPFSPTLLATYDSDAFSREEEDVLVFYNPANKSVCALTQVLSREKDRKLVVLLTELEDRVSSLSLLPSSEGLLVAFLNTEQLVRVTTDGTSESNWAVMSTSLTYTPLISATSFSLPFPALSLTVLPSSSSPSSSSPSCLISTREGSLYTLAITSSSTPTLLTKSPDSNAMLVDTAAVETSSGVTVLLAADSLKNQVLVGSLRFPSLSTLPFSSAAYTPLWPRAIQARASTAVEDGVELYLAEGLGKVTKLLLVRDDATGLAHIRSVNALVDISETFELGSMLYEALRKRLQTYGTASFLEKSNKVEATVALGLDLSSFP